MQTILCPSCKEPIEISQAIADQVSEEDRKQQQEAIATAREEERKSAEKKLREEILLKEKDYKNQLREDRERIEKLTQSVLSANTQMRELQKKDEERELENQKKLVGLEQKAKEEATKKAEETMKYEVLEMKKKLEDTQKLLEEAKRKSEQGSQQLQGEVFELDIEQLLRAAFPYDVIEPVGKGISGADIRHIVKSPMGNTCGVILWELKRTKHWDDKWILKLKDDLRNEKAHVPVIVSQQLPLEAKTGLGVKEKVWVCNFSLILPLAELLRTNLYDVARQKASQANSTEKAQLLYSYITSHEFQQQVESMVEVYKSMQEQLVKERVAYEKIWKTREAQITKVLLSTAGIIGSIQGTVGASMPTIKGLELLELGEGEV